MWLAKARLPLHAFLCAADDNNNTELMHLIINNELYAAATLAKWVLFARMCTPLVMLSRKQLITKVIHSLILY